MEKVLAFFPLSKGVHRSNVAGFVIALVIYCVVSFVFGLAASLVSFLPIISLLASLVSYLVELYCAAGVVLAIVKFVRNI